MDLDENKLAEWERVVSEVNKDHIPIQCVKKLILKLKNNKRKTINVNTLRKNGVSIENIEESISEQISEYGDEIQNIEFVIDVTLVAEMIQPITDKILQKIS